MSTTALTLTHLPAGANGFFRAPVLISGATQAILIDGGFTFSDGQAVLEAIRASGKELTCIYISQSDPDFYFSLKPIKAAFPNARVIAASATINSITASIEKKLAVWGPQLKENGPQTLADIVMPEAFDEPSLQIDGHTIEIIDAQGLANRRYLYVPSLHAVVGGVMVFANVHVWTADTASSELRAAWVANLDRISALNPSVVVAGHMSEQATTDLSAVAHTKAYLLDFEVELSKAKNASDLKTAMEAKYPNLGLGVALDIGAKVALGEMQWG